MRGDVFLIGMVIFFALGAPASIFIPRRFHDSLSTLAIVLAIACIGMALLLAHHAL